ncbi:LacI family transcriptional regulator [Rhizobium anhuiense]|uniref:LacI family transcriptional regulator n=1 Tax=Rhizobium anhuiense TaxID=1184720 RepID=A0ABX4JFI8_9HYPH|nr:MULTISPECIES: LacI family DNA-binding transcriptional regulator [Rhizobium]MBB3300007.1 LacI family repressor for deo operon, udp, cdd, tsx, nupC, and nupG [Rhizobium sp. BK112]MBB3369464.1 LacI family repressor for deo operon, udp, cdd, tsx, nupC, and nupG [Rhizobium sp. BK077]MBB4112569.1 LacI family repressor for deo operon, udp, cdd, tsx, nupC, and nupG [Rhizobium sp. BK226]MBB4179991.1 LacI family repressor for deo operon, udp, cdd, tsx, nupC, and nupG [Rhizobium sp. BK109]MBB4213010.1
MNKNKDVAGEEPSGALMADVARLAGVAISTVSRALANPGRVNEKTRAKINAAARQLGYTPNAMARGLRVGKSNIIMIILPGSLYYGVSQIIPQVLQSINKSLIQGGYNLMIANLDRDEISERHILDLAFGGSVRGAIILSSKLPEVDGRSLANSGLPIVSMLLDMSDAGLQSVVTNDREAVRDVTAELIRLGHRRFFYLAGPEGNYHDVERYAGVLEALEAAGLSDELVRRSGGHLDYQHGFDIGVQAADDFAQLTEKPTAVIATSDDMAISFVSCIQRGGLRIPDDLSVVSFDGSPVCEFSSPPLSTIEQPVEEMGRAAVDLLLDAIDQRQKTAEVRTVIRSRLILRESVAAPKS